MLTFIIFAIPKKLDAKLIFGFRAVNNAWFLPVVIPFIINRHFPAGHSQLLYYKNIKCETCQALSQR